MLEYVSRLYEQLRLFGHLFASYFKMIEGVWKVSQLKAPVVTIFGGSKLAQDHPYAHHARAFGQLLAEYGMSVITGGGPAIMEAANCGAFEKYDGVRSVGITVRGLAPEHLHTCADTMVQVNHLFARKWLLTRYASAFVVFPGGFGTLDELFEILTLMQVNKLAHLPVILFGKAYWKPLMEWVALAVKEGLVLQRDADLIFVTDDNQEAFEYLKKNMTH